MPTPIDIDEAIELSWRYPQYRAAWTSLKPFFQKWKEDYEKSLGEGEELVEDPEWIRKVMQENDEENARIGEIRQQFFRDRQEMRKAARIEQAAAWEDYKQSEDDKSRQLLLEIESNIEHILTEDNVETKIDEALDAPVDYNFAIDRTGKRIMGLPKLDDQGRMLVYDHAEGEIRQDRVEVEEVEEKASS